MMRLRTAAAALVLLSTMAFADELMLRGPSKEAFDASYSEMVKQVPADQGKVFLKGFMQILMRRYSESTGEKSDTLMALGNAAQAAPILMDGVSFTEIMEAGKAAGNPGGKGDMENPEADLAGCLSQKVVVTKATITDRSSFATGQFEITNGLSWPIGFVVIHYRITSAGREMPWDEQTVGMDVRGGISPGETRKVQTMLNLNSDAPKDLVLAGEVKDVADSQKRQVIGKPKYMGNAEELSPLKCGR